MAFLWESKTLVVSFLRTDESQQKFCDREKLENVPRVSLLLVLSHHLPCATFEIVKIVSLSPTTTRPTNKFAYILIRFFFFFFLPLCALFSPKIKTNKNVIKVANEHKKVFRSNGISTIYGISIAIANERVEREIEIKNN